MKSEGWFANPPNSDDEWHSFLSLSRQYRISSVTYIKKYSAMAHYALFGYMSKWSCDECAGYDRSECKMRSSSICKKEKVKSFFSEVYTKPNYYYLWQRIFPKYMDHKDAIIEIIGQYRFDAFIEYLTVNAHDDYQRFTKREINENSYVEPTIITAPLITLEEIQNDNWQKFVSIRIKKGEEQCSHYSDLGLSVF